MNGLWLLAINGATAVEYGSLGLNIGALTLSSLAADELVLIEDGRRCDEADSLEYEDKVELFYQSDPDDTGTRRRVFVGEIVTPENAENRTGATKTYTAHAAWRWLERRKFKQTVALPDSGAVSGYTTLKWEHVFLGYRVVADSTPGGLPYIPERITNGVQIEEALQYVLDSCDAFSLDHPFQFTPAEFAGILVPVDERREIFCAEAIRNQSRWTPGGSWFDYNTAPLTDPPTFHYSDYAGMTAVERAITGADEVRVIELPEFQFDAVAITYQLKGDSGFEVVRDIWPALADPEGFKVFTATIDLQGPTRQTETAEIEVEPIVLGTHTPAAPNVPVRNWFFAHFKELEDIGAGNTNRISELSIIPLYLTGQPIPLANEVLSGHVPAWVGASRREELTWKVSYKILDENGATVRTVASELKKKLIATTDVTSGTYNHSVGGDSGDGIPPTGANGLAAKMLEGLGQIPKRGVWSKTAQEIDFDLRPGLALNLTGGKAAWTTMRAPIQTVTFDIQHGRTTVNFGWPEHLGIDDLVELYRVTRARQIWSSPQQQAGDVGDAEGTGRTPLADRAEAGTRKSLEVFGTTTAATVTHTTEDGSNAQTIAKGHGLGSGIVKTTHSTGGQCELASSGVGNSLRVGNNDIVLLDNSTNGTPVAIRALSVRLNGVTVTMRAAISIPS